MVAGLRGVDVVSWKSFLIECTFSASSFYDSSMRLIYPPSTREHHSCLHLVCAALLLAARQTADGREQDVQIQIERVSMYNHKFTTNPNPNPIQSSSSQTSHNSDTNCFN